MDLFGRKAKAQNEELMTTVIALRKRVMALEMWAIEVGECVIPPHPFSPPPIANVGGPSPPPRP